MQKEKTAGGLGSVQGVGVQLRKRKFQKEEKGKKEGGAITAREGGKGFARTIPIEKEGEKRPHYGAMGGGRVLRLEKKAVLADSIRRPSREGKRNSLSKKGESF